MKVNDIFRTDPSEGYKFDPSRGYYSYITEIKEGRNIRGYSYYLNPKKCKLTGICSTSSKYIRIVPVPKEVNTEHFRAMLVSDDLDARNVAIEIIKQYERI